jgi:hypothetical protein
MRPNCFWGAQGLANRRDFLAAVAESMRRILVENPRAQAG